MTRDTSGHPASPVVLTVPGLNGSGPAHWQTLWEQSRADTVRVELGMWSTPHRNVWVTRLDEAIRNVGGPVVLVAHSLGCLAVAWWAELTGQPYGYPVAGALLVAPADVDRAAAPLTLKAFAPSPQRLLPFPSIVAASSDDPWVSLHHARSLAASWGSHLIDMGPQGHLNAASGIGSWSEGQELLDRVLSAATGGNGSPSAPAEARLMLQTASPPERRLHS